MHIERSFIMRLVCHHLYGSGWPIGMASCLPLLCFSDAYCLLRQTTQISQIKSQSPILKQGTDRSETVARRLSPKARIALKSQPCQIRSIKGTDSPSRGSSFHFSMLLHSSTPSRNNQKSLYVRPQSSFLCYTTLTNQPRDHDLAIRAHLRSSPRRFKGPCSLPPPKNNFSRRFNFQLLD